MNTKSLTNNLVSLTYFTGQNPSEKVGLDRHFQAMGCLLHLSVKNKWYRICLSVGLTVVTIILLQILYTEYHRNVYKNTLICILCIIQIRRRRQRVRRDDRSIWCVFEEVCFLNLRMNVNFYNFCPSFLRSYTQFMTSTGCQHMSILLLYFLIFPFYGFVKLPSYKFILKHLFPNECVLLHIGLFFVT